MVSLVRTHLKSRRDELWNKPMQLLVRLRLESLVPLEVPEWDDATQGREYLDAMWHLLEAHPDERTGCMPHRGSSFRRSSSMASAQASRISSRISVMSATHEVPTSFRWGSRLSTIEASVSCNEL